MNIKNLTAKAILSSLVWILAIQTASAQAGSVPTLSLRCHTELNPAIWDGDELKPTIRAALLKFADAWATYVNVSPSLIENVIMVGGNAHYNYTDKSDIDVHIVVNKAKLDPNQVMLEDYLFTKKMLWQSSHQITVYGYPIEPYVEDPTKVMSPYRGVYSLKNNEWMQRPNASDCKIGDTQKIERAVQDHIQTIDQMIANKADADAFKALKDKLKTLRSIAIAQYGEFTFENLVFKELRNRQYIDKIDKYEQNLRDQELSLR
ncbi:MAG: hypothetical protein ACKO0Z_17645 [Betaproteobacteria bacterium]